MTMELILNLIWLLVASALLCVWRTQWVHQKFGRARGRVQEWSAVSLALVLLFFAVSMSDDMHSEIVALEELSSNKREYIQTAVGHPLAPSSLALHSVVWNLPSRPQSPGHIHEVSAVLLANLDFEFRLTLHLKPTRAPPLAIL